eukprot:867879-Prymnesium_polylepis.2
MQHVVNVHRARRVDAAECQVAQVEPPRHLVVWDGPAQRGEALQRGVRVLVAHHVVLVQQRRTLRRDIARDAKHTLDGCRRELVGLEPSLHRQNHQLAAQAVRRAPVVRRIALARR